MTRDGIAGLICLALSIGLLVLSRGLPQSSFVPMGPEFYPRIVLVIMAVLSVMLVASDLWRQRTQTAAAAAAEPAPEKRNYRLVGITFAVFAGYVVLLPLVGYRVATFLFMVALQAVIDRAARGAGSWCWSPRWPRPPSPTSCSTTICPCCCRADTGPGGKPCSTSCLPESRTSCT